MVEMAREPLVQSGGIYSLVPTKANTKNISADIITITNWIKYRNYHCAASRTLLIDATEDQKKAYKALLGCFQYCTSQLSAGKRIKDIYNEGVKYVQEHDSEFVQYLPKSFGWGTGCLENEKLLEINAENEATIVPGSVFELNIGIEGMSNSKMNYSMILADTLLIGAEGKTREILTGAVSKAFKDVSYSMAPEENDQAKRKEEEKTKIDSSVVRAGKALNDVWSNERQLRTKSKPQDLAKEAVRKEHQKKLAEEKMLEMEERLSSNKIGTSQKVNELRKLTDVSSYDSPSQFPSDTKFGNVYIDSKRESLLVPIGTRIIPFHVSTIKNVSKTDEAGGSFLRVNFHVPGDGAAFNTPLGFPKPKGDNFAFLKEITIRMHDPKTVANAHKIIKELIKRLKVRDQEKKEKEGLVAQKGLILLQGKKPILTNVSLRPNITGKKTTGILEGHKNGLRFISGKSERVEVIYENIKHAFYQPCENELIVLIHFHLKNPIMIGNKKTKDVQFYSEVGLAADDLNMRRRNLQDMDEMEQESQERQFRLRLDNEFKRFSDEIEKLSKIEFDIPYRELGFYGVPIKTNVFLLPTLNCLVNLTEVPFFVVSLNDIEIVHFERVNFSLRNFDMVLIFKDLTNFVRIGCIPSESLEPIKDWLNEVNVIYSEGVLNLNWTNLLAKIRDDPKDFLDQGGWNFLQDDSNSVNSEDDKEMQEDSEFSPEPEEEGSEYSEEESEEYSEGDESEEEDPGTSINNLNRG
jgi:nucleosome binding factor SPN SPT16 subunit